MANESWGENDDVVSSDWGAGDTAVADASVVDPDYRPAPQIGMVRDFAQKVGGTIDRFSGAPIRGMIDESSRGSGPTPYNVGAGFVRGMRDPSSVPSFKDLAGRAGVDTTQIPIMSINGRPVSLSPAGVAGFVGEMAVPLPPIMKGIKLGMGLVKASAKTGLRAGALTHEIITGSQAGRDVVAGVEKGLERVKEGKKTALIETFSPQRIPDADEYRNIAAEANLTPDEIDHLKSIDYGKLSVQNRRRQALAQGPEGGQELAIHNNSVQKIQYAYEDAIRKIGGEPLTATRAGEVIRDGVFDGLKNLRNKVTMTHDEIVNRFNPPINGDELKTLNSKMAGIEKRAKGVLLRGTKAQKADAEDVISQIESLRNSSGSYKQLNEARAGVGEVAFKKKGGLERVPFYEQELRDLYFASNDALLGSVRKLDKVRAGQFRKPGEPSFQSLADQLEDGNKIISEAMSDKGVVTKAIGFDRKAGEDIFSDAILNGDTETIKALKNFLPPETLQRLKGTTLATLTKRGADGNILYGQTKKGWGTRQAMMAELFTPEELFSVDKFARLSDRVGPPLMPGSAGQLDFANQITNPVASAYRAGVSEPLSAIAEEIGLARSRRLAPINYRPLSSDVTGYAKKNRGVFPMLDPATRVLRSISTKPDEE